MLGAEEGRAPFGAWCQDRGPVPSCVGAGCCGHTPAVPEALLSPQLACTGWQKPGCWRGPAACGQVGEPALLLCTFLWGWMMAKVEKVVSKQDEDAGFHQDSSFLLSLLASHQSLGDDLFCCELC